MTKLICRTSLVVAIIAAGFSAESASAGRPGSYRPKAGPQPSVQQQDAVLPTQVAVSPKQPPTTPEPVRVTQAQQLPMQEAVSNPKDDSEHAKGFAEQADAADRDVILAVNGHSTDRSDCWTLALHEALAGEGKIVLTVFNRNTAALSYRTVELISR